MLWDTAGQEEFDAITKVSENFKHWALLSLFSVFYMTIKCIQCDIAKQFTPTYYQPFIISKDISSFGQEDIEFEALHAIYILNWNQGDTSFSV